MNSLIRSVAVLTVVFLAPSALHARTGNELLEECQVIDKTEPLSADNAMSGVQCYEYIEGVLDGFDLARQLENLPKEICLGDGVTTEQIARIVLKTLRDNPERLNRRGDLIVVKGVKDAFPCSLRK